MVAILVKAVNKPGLIMKAYSAFSNYSVGNQVVGVALCPAYAQICGNIISELTPAFDMQNKKAETV